MTTNVQKQVANGIWIIPMGMLPGALPLLRRPHGGIAVVLFAVVACGCTAGFSLLLRGVFRRGRLSPLQETILSTAAYVVTFGVSLATVFASVRIAG